MSISGLYGVDTLAELVHEVERFTDELGAETIRLLPRLEYGGAVVTLVTIPGHNLSWELEPVAEADAIAYFDRAWKLDGVEETTRTYRRDLGASRV